MFCDLCAKNEATVHLSEIINDQTRELHLCEVCAQEKGAAAAQHFGLADLLAGLADFGVKPEGRTEAAKSACGRCGMTYDDFRKLGRLGCGGCYGSFEKFLSPLLRKIHGSSHHVGQVPTAAPSEKGAARDEHQQLKEKLKSAVAAEDFEEAARLRDRIRSAEKKKKK